MTNRRIFLKQAGLLTATAIVSPSFLLKKFKLGLQLYSIRGPLARDLQGTLQQVAAFGYEEVEIYGFSDSKYYGLEPSAFKSILDENNLTTSSGHYDLNKFMLPGVTDDQMFKYVDECIEGAHTLKQKYITWPWLDPESRTIDKFKIVADKLNRIGERLKPANLKVAYHNHDFEFIEHNGQIGYDVILKETDPSLVKLQADLYWLANASKLKPHDYFVQHPGRYPMWHLKDMSKQDRNLHEIMGEGTIDFKTIMKDTVVSGVEHMFVEQGNNYHPDPMDNVGKSALYVKNVLFKKM